MTSHSGYWVKDNRLVNRTEAKLPPLYIDRVAWTTIKYYSYSAQGCVVGAIRINCGDVARVDEHESKKDCLKWLDRAYKDYYLLAAEDESSGFMVAVDATNPNGNPPSSLAKPIKRPRISSAASGSLHIVPLVKR